MTDHTHISSKSRPPRSADASPFQLATVPVAQPAGGGVLVRSRLLPPVP